MEKWKPSKILVDKIQEHNGIVKCPYCKQLFDVHAGIMFLENKQVGPIPKPGISTEEFFKRVMKK